MIARSGRFGPDALCGFVSAARRFSSVGNIGIIALQCGGARRWPGRAPRLARRASTAQLARLLLQGGGQSRAHSLLRGPAVYTIRAELIVISARPHL
jgi:hypothetical protein